jgi:hypothetical protein
MERMRTQIAVRVMVFIAMPPSSPTPRILLRDDVLVLATWRSVVLAKWAVPPSAKYMSAMRERLRPFVRSATAFGAINVVALTNVTTLSEEARAEIAATQREFESKQRGLATVIEGKGFFGATVRSAAAGLALLSRVKFPQKIFDSTDAAAKWMASLLDDVGVDRSSELARVLETTFRESVAHP